jgi:gliding motility-associated-like protein
LKIFKIFSSLLLSANLFVVSNTYSQTEFIENKGQWDRQVTFMTNAGSGAFFLQKKGFTVLQNNPVDLERLIHKDHVKPTPASALEKNILHSHAYAVQFVGANENAEIVPDKVLPSVNNYFIGNDKSKWAGSCKIYGGVTYKNVYPNIDVRYYSDAGTRLKYDIIVHPGGDVNNIALQYKGADGLAIKDKELIIKTSIGDNKELSPYTYEVTNYQRKDVETKYVIKGNVVTFKVKDHSPNSTLIIDPTLVFFSYTGSSTDNWGFTATYGPDGSFFSGGIVFGNGFPVSTGAYQTSFVGGERDIAIMKLTPDGKNRVYATYIGGGGSEQPHSLVVDPQGNLILAGRTNSPDYPVFPTGNKFGSGGGWDIVVTKLNAAGNALIGSIVIGGTSDDGVNITTDEGLGMRSLKRNYGDDARSEVIIDGANNIYVASCTQSTGSSGTFPTTAGVFQPGPAVSLDPSNNQDGVVIKLSPNCNSVLWSSFLGGSDNDAAYVLALGNNNNLYVAGGTASNNMPEISSSGVLSSTFSGPPCDGFVVELNNNGTSAIRGTYLGTSASDEVYGVQTDISGNVYVMGTTEGSWPVVNAVYSNPNSKQFISKLDPNLSAYIYSTVFGSGSPLPNISPTAFLVDRCENVYVSGWGGKADYKLGFNNSTTKGMPVTADAIKPVTDQSGSDFYFIVIKKDASALLYGTFFGQEDPIGDTPLSFGDHVDGGTSRFDKNGVIYQAICANCNKSISFFGTPGAWSTTNNASGGGQCNLGMLKIKMNFAGVEAGPQASINGIVNDTSGCVPLKVDFTDTIQNGKNYVWDFGDGTPRVTSTAVGVSHTYNAVGVYLVTHIAIDSTTCNIADTAYLKIRVGNNKATLDFIPNKTGLCTDLSYIFTNTSSASTAPFSANSFTWDFGDGSPRIISGTTPPVTHTYSGAGTYIVKLILSDTSFCNSPDSVSKTVRLSPIVKAKFNTPASGCVPYNAVFDNISAGGLNFLWDFGDGTTSTADNPTHLYSTVGTYTVKLYAFDSTSCNKIDSTTFNISVVDIPTANFTFSPVPPKENTFTQFTNQSTGATNYVWNFGDGDSSNEVNPQHLFNATGTYNVCLTAINAAGCNDSICMAVSAIINPLLDVPSAFTPGKFGINGIISVKGFGIKQMQWTIYNRWGQKVFESGSPSNGWDGYYKGKLQQMDVYTYTLDVIFSDGTKTRKVGDITLIR